MNHTKKIIISMISSLFFTLMPAAALAQQDGLAPVTPLSGMAQGQLVPAIGAIANVFLGFVGVVAVIFATIGGVQYITSGSDEGGQEKAKNRILYGVIGLVMVGLAAAIVNFTINAVRGSGSGSGTGGTNIIR